MFYKAIFAALAAAALATPSAFGATMTYGVGAAVRGGMFAGLTSGGVAVNGRVSKFELEAGSMSGKEDVSSSLGYSSLFGIFGDYEIKTAEIKQVVNYGMLKLHPMDGSFYFGFGGGKAKATATLKAQSTSGAETLDEVMTIDRTIEFLSIGNVWTPGGVIIGCEWIGAGSALKTKESTESKSNTGTNEELVGVNSDFRDKVHHTIGKDVTNALVVYLGFMIGH